MRELVCILIVVVVIGVYTYVKTHRTLYPKKLILLYVNFINFNF